MVRMLLGLPELFFFVVAQKLQLKEKLISLKVFFFNVVLASKEFLYYIMCFSITVLTVLKLCLLITSTFIFPELRILKKCY